MQLKVEIPKSFDETRGRLSFRVLKSVHGDFPSKKITLNVGNVDHCNSYIFTFGSNREGYVTARSMAYSDGEPVETENGAREFAPIFYQDIDLGTLVAGPMPQFADYSQFQSMEFFDDRRGQCLSDGDFTDDAWRRCVKPGEYVSLSCQDNHAGALICTESEWLEGRPDDLKRGYSEWAHKGPPVIGGLLVLLTLAGLGVHVWKIRGIS